MRRAAAELSNWTSRSRLLVVVVTGRVEPRDLRPWCDAGRRPRAAAWCRALQRLRRWRSTPLCRDRAPRLGNALGSRRCRVGRAGLDPRCRDRHFLGEDLRQPGLFGQPERRQPRVRHEMVLVEARGAGGEPLRGGRSAAATRGQAGGRRDLRNNDHGLIVSRSRISLMRRAPRRPPRAGPRSPNAGQDDAHVRPQHDRRRDVRPAGSAIGRCWCWFTRGMSEVSLEPVSARNRAHVLRPADLRGGRRAGRVVRSC